jgi:hypothetical protein
MNIPRYNMQMKNSYANIQLNRRVLADVLSPGPRARSPFVALRRTRASVCAVVYSVLSLLESVAVAFGYGLRVASPEGRGAVIGAVQLGYGMSLFFMEVTGAWGAHWSIFA